MSMIVLSTHAATDHALTILQSFVAVYCTSIIQSGSKKFHPFLFAL